MGNAEIMASSIGAMTIMASSALGAPLTGSGSNLTLPSPNPGAPAFQSPTLTPVGSGFTGEWVSPAQPDWIGTFSATGPVPVGLSNPTGLTRYDFSGLPLNVAPTGTILALSDLDGGSQTGEQIILRAFDGAGGALTTPWLDEVFGVSGSGTGAGGTPTAGNMPGWDWNAGTGTYTFSGSTFGGNPSVSVWLFTNTDMASLEVERTSGFASFSINAPVVPGPGAAGLLLLSGLSMARRRR